MPKELNNIYLLYGEEEYLTEKAVKNIKKEFGDLILGINYIKIDESNLNTLIPNIETPAFGFNKKLIEIRKSGLFKKPTKGTNVQADILSTYIEENIEFIKTGTILIFVEKEISKNSLQKTLEKYGQIQNFERLSSNEITKQIIKICAQYEVKIDVSVAQFFVETCGTNFQNLINEIRKLIEYVGKQGTITKDTIELLSIKELDSIIFDLTDNLGKKDIKEALIILKELIYNKEPIQKILITLYGHFKKIYITIIAQETNRNIVESLNLKQTQMFLATKYKNQAKYFKKEELRRILHELIELDYNSKQGLIDVNIGLEAILCTYCGK